jgi:hypothetical protein
MEVTRDRVSNIARCVLQSLKKLDQQMSAGKRLASGIGERSEPVRELGLSDRAADDSNRVSEA